MITIGINASFLRKQHTGIGQVTVNFLRKLTELQGDHKRGTRFILYLEEDVAFELPSHFSKRVLRATYKRDDLIRKIWWEKILLPRAAQQDGCDLFLSLYQSASIFSDIPHLMVVHDLIPRIFPVYLSNSRKRLYQNLIEKAIKKSDHIIAVSKHTEKDMIRLLGMNAQDISVAYTDVDPIYKKQLDEIELARVRKKYGLQKGYIYSGGGFEVRKNIEQLLRAYKYLITKEVAQKIPPLVISGKLIPELVPLGYDVQVGIAELDLQEQVVLLGFVPQEDMPALYRNAALFAYPSLYEGFGLPVLEAMSQGTPVVTSKTTSLPEVGSDTVLYCDPRDYQDLAMAMGNILRNDDLQAALSLKGKQRSAVFSWELFAQKTLNIIFSMLKK